VVLPESDQMHIPGSLVSYQISAVPYSNVKRSIGHCDRIACRC